MAEIEYRKNDGTWRALRSFQDLTHATLGLEINETLEIRKRCLHDRTFVENGIKTCRTCGRQLEVTSYRD